MAKTCKILKSYRDMVKTFDCGIPETLPNEKIICIVQLFDQLEDVRCSSLIKYSLSEILLIAFFAVLANADTWVEIERFGKAKIEWLRTFLPLKNGVPSHDTFQRVFGLIERKSLQKLTVEYLNDTMNGIRRELEKVDENANENTKSEQEEYRHLSMDGKEERGTGRKPGTDTEIPNVQTFHIYDTTTGVCLESEPIDNKTNEIPVAQNLLGMMNLRRCIVTADALHTQKETCRIIVEQNGNYILGLKGNQPKLLAEVQSCFTEEKRNSLRDTRDKKEPMYWEETEKAHNQNEIRRYFMVKAQHESTGQDDVWPGLKWFICVEKEIENIVTHEKRIELRYYIASIGGIQLCAELIRSHWKVENSLHWQLDYTFHFDENSTMDREALTNLGLLKKMALSVLKLFQPLMPGRTSLRVIRKMASWQPETVIPAIFRSFTPETIKMLLSK